MFYFMTGSTISNRLGLAAPGEEEGDLPTNKITTITTMFVEQRLASLWSAN